MLHKRHTLIDGGGVLLELESTPNLGWTIHCDIERWGAEVYKELVDLWSNVLDVLKQKGIKELFIYADEEKAYKFANMFGFAPTGIAGITTLGSTSAIWMYKL